MKRLFYWLMLSAFFTFTGQVRSQTIILTGSSSQGWSGGIAGRHGTNYSFSISFRHLKQRIMPDTIWIGDTPVALMPGDTGGTGNMSIRYSPDKTSAVVTINASVAGENERTLEPPSGGSKPVPKHIPYRGVALLSYRYGNEKRHFAVKRFFQVLPPINYP